jgi:phosphatidylinositol 3-kinase
MTCRAISNVPYGSESVYFGKFKTYCCEAYNILRKNVVLILNLFSLMVGRCRLTPG